MWWQAHNGTFFGKESAVAFAISFAILFAITYAISFAISVPKDCAMPESTLIALTIDSAGRVILPSAVRRQLKLVTGSRLQLAVVAQRIELTPEPDAMASVQGRSGKRAVLPPSGKPSSAAAAVRAERDRQDGGL